MSKFWTNQWTAYIMILFSLHNFLIFYYPGLLVSDSFPRCPEDLSSSRLDDTESSHPCSLYPEKKIIFKMTYLVLQSTCKIKLQNDTLLVTVFKRIVSNPLTARSQIIIVLWQRKSVWISFYHNIFNYWCQIKDSCNQSFISQKIIGHGTPQSDYNVMMCAIGLGWHTSILKMNFSNKIYTHCMMENAILF